MAPSRVCGGESRRGRGAEVLYIAGEIGIDLEAGGDGGGDVLELAEKYVPEDEELPIDSGGDGVRDREVERPPAWALHEDMFDGFEKR